MYSYNMRSRSVKNILVSILLLGTMFSSTAYAAHNRAEKESEIRDSFRHVCFGGQYNAFQVIPIAVDAYFLGGQISVEWLKNEAIKTGISAAECIAQSGYDPSRDEIIGGMMTFEIWAVSRDLAYNAHVPYVGIRKKDTDGGGGPASITPEYSGPLDSFAFQYGTALHETGSEWEFGAMPDLDIVAIKKNGGGSNTTELHILEHDQGYRNFRLQTKTALHETGGDWAFTILKNGDIMAINKKGTGSSSTEVHILNADDGYQSFRLQTGTALHETDGNWDFAALPDRDLMAIKKKDTGTDSTEVHILEADNNYSAFRLQTGTALHETGAGWDFSVLPDGDLLAIAKSNTGTGTTEVHRLDAAANYGSFVGQAGTPLHETSTNFDFAGPVTGRLLLAIKKSQTGSNSTEVHALRVE